MEHVHLVSLFGEESVHHYSLRLTNTVSPRLSLFKTRHKPNQYLDIVMHPSLGMTNFCHFGNR